MTEKTQLTELRDADFTAKLEEMAASMRRKGIRPTDDELIDAALMSRPRQYYLSFAYVMRRLCALRKNGFLDEPRRVSADSPRAIWFEIDAKVRAYRLRHRRATNDEAVAHRLNFCSPERFYISRATARRIFLRRFHTKISYD